MNKAMLSLLSESEMLLIQETELSALKELDEDEVSDVLLRIRRARNKHSKNYRRQSAARVTTKGSRGAAVGSSNKTAVKAEIFEDALARVSRRLAQLAKESAAELRTVRLEAARAGRSTPRAPGRRPSGTRSPASTHTSVSPTRSKRRPARVKRVASTRAAGARRQARKDSR